MSDIPAEVLDAAKFENFEERYLVYYLKKSYSWGDAWNLTAATSNGLGVKRVGWRKCHTENYWAWYGLDRIERYGIRGAFSIRDSRTKNQETLDKIMECIHDALLDQGFLDVVVEARYPEGPLTDEEFAAIVRSLK